MHKFFALSLHLKFTLFLFPADEIIEDKTKINATGRQELVIPFQVDGDIVKVSSQFKADLPGKDKPHSSSGVESVSKSVLVGLISLEVRIGNIILVPVNVDNRIFLVVKVDVIFHDLAVIDIQAGLCKEVHFFPVNREPVVDPEVEVDPLFTAMNAEELKVRLGQVGGRIDVCGKYSVGIKLCIINFKKNSPQTCEIVPEKKASSERHMVMHVCGKPFNDYRIRSVQQMLDLLVPVIIGHYIVDGIDIPVAAVVIVGGVFVGKTGSEVDPEIPSCDPVLFHFFPVQLFPGFGLFLCARFVGLGHTGQRKKQG